MTESPTTKPIIRVNTLTAHKGDIENKFNGQAAQELAVHKNLKKLLCTANCMCANCTSKNIEGLNKIFLRN